MDVTGDQYNLKWNNHCTTFIQTFVERFNSESLVDVTLSCEGHFIKAHKLVLSACSDYFFKMFQTQDVKYPIIYLNGVKFIDLSAIIHFIYHGQVRVLDKHLPGILALGESLQIKGLSSIKIRDFPAETSNDTTDIQNINVKKSSVQELRNEELEKATCLRLPKSKAVNVPIKVYTRNKQKSTSSPKMPGCSRTKIARLTYSKVINTDANTDLNDPIKENISSKTNKFVTKTTDITPPKSTNSTIISPSSNDSDARITPPKHAFMIFATEWRKKLTIEHPKESNKEISIRLGNMWKNLSSETRNYYYQQAATNAEEEKKDNDVNFKVILSDSEESKAADVPTNTHSETVDPLEILEEVYIADSD